MDTTNPLAGQMGGDTYALCSRDGARHRCSGHRPQIAIEMACCAWQGSRARKKRRRQNLRRIHADTGAAMCDRAAGSELTGLWARQEAD